MAAIRDLENFNRVACCGGSFTVFFCSPRPAAAVIADLPVSYVPGDDALCRVRARHRCCVARRRIALRPAAAMDDHRDGKGSAAGGKAQLVKLAWIFPVCLDKSRFRREQSIPVGQLMPTSA